MDLNNPIPARRLRRHPQRRSPSRHTIFTAAETEASIAKIRPAPGSETPAPRGVLQGWGGKSLLNSYESERKPIAVRNTRAARAIAKQVGVLDIPAGMEEDPPAGAVLRQEVGAQVATYLGTQFAPIGVELGARYDGSPIIASDEAAPTDSIVQYIPTP